QQVIIPRGLEWPAGEDAKEARVPRSVIPSDRRAPRDTLSSTSLGERETHRRPRVPHPPSPSLTRGWEAKDRVLGKEASRHDFNDLDGVVVEVEITEWPSPTETPRGAVYEMPR